MPFYFYRPTGSRSCNFCRDGFDRLQKLDDVPLQRCPECGAEVKKEISAPNLASNSPSLSEDSIEKHGFTQYKKLEKGVYEKTAGKGPALIADNKEK